MKDEDDCLPRARPFEFLWFVSVKQSHCIRLNNLRISFDFHWIPSSDSDLVTIYSLKQKWFFKIGPQLTKKIGKCTWKIHKVENRTGGGTLNLLFNVFLKSVTKRLSEKITYQILRIGKNNSDKWNFGNIGNHQNVKWNSINKFIVHSVSKKSNIN